MYTWLPENVALQTDVSAASWVVEGLRPWGISYPQPVACFLPDVFEAYARVLHPGREYRRTDDGSIVVSWTRWSELGAQRGVEVGATTTWEEVSGFAPQAGPVDGVDDPYEGSMPDVLVEMVAAFVRRWTTRQRRPGSGCGRAMACGGRARTPFSPPVMIGTAPLNCYASTMSATEFFALPPRSARHSVSTS